jgi:hypothetical protein
LSGTGYAVPDFFYLPVMKDIVFKLTIRNQLNALTNLFIRWMIIFPLLWFGVHMHFQSAVDIGLYLLFFLIDMLPTLLVHIQYVRWNWKAKLIVNRESASLRYQSPTQVLEYKFEDITLLQHVAHPGSGVRFSFGGYRYFKIGFKDGEEIMVTWLMMPDIAYRMEMLLGMAAQKKVRVVAFIY